MGVVTVTKAMMSSSCTSGRDWITEKQIIEPSTMNPVPSVVPKVGAWTRS